jgi:hypothetical protein
MSEEGEKTPQSKETSHGLPIVSQDTVSSIWQHYTTVESWGEHLEEVKARLVKENPNLVKFIESQVSKYPPTLHNSMFEVVVSTVAVLESQAEANKLSSQFNLDEPTDK